MFDATCRKMGYLSGKIKEPLAIDDTCEMWSMDYGIVKIWLVVAMEI